MSSSSTRCSIALVALVACGKDDTATPDAASADAASVDAAPDAATTEVVRLRFAAKVNGALFVCGQTYPDVGTPPAPYTTIDFRFYVHDVKLITPSGDVPVTLYADNFQTAGGIALLDFETGGTACQMGSTATHTEVVGHVPLGTTYTGVRFKIGVPFDKNHLDATLAVSPMNIPAMYWAWSSGYKFIKADGRSGTQGFAMHVGSTGCNGTGSMPPSQACTSPNVMELVFSSFTPNTSVIVADVGHVLADADVTANTADTPQGCMSDPTDPECDTIMPKLGLPFRSFPVEPQRFLTVE